jgi:hypothetical protein
LRRADPAERHRAIAELLAGATEDLLLAA